MNDINKELAASGLKTYVIVMTLEAFKISEHENPKLVLEYGMNDKDFGLVLFFDGNCYIQEYDKKWMVVLGSNEYEFDIKDDAISHLYHNHYLVECTELF